MHPLRWLPIDLRHRRCAAMTTSTGLSIPWCSPSLIYEVFLCDDYHPLFFVVWVSATYHDDRHIWLLQAYFLISRKLPELATSTFTITLLLVAFTFRPEMTSTATSGRQQIAQTCSALAVFCLDFSISFNRFRNGLQFWKKAIHALHFLFFIEQSFVLRGWWHVFHPPTEPYLLTTLCTQYLQMHKHIKWIRVTFVSCKFVYHLTLLSHKLWLFLLALIT